MRYAGVSEEDVPRISVNIERSLSKAARVYSRTVGGITPIGEYNPITKKMILFADSFWWNREGTVQSAKQVIEGGFESLEALNSSAMSDMKSLRRLSAYLLYAPPERALKTVERLADIKMRRTANSVIAHEASHAADDSRNGPMMLFYNLIEGREKLVAVRGLIALGLGAAGVVAARDPDVIQKGVGGLAVAAGTMAFFAYKNRKSDYPKIGTETRAFEFEVKTEGRFNFLTIAPKVNQQVTSPPLA